MNTTQPTATQVADVIRGQRYRYADEHDLQAGIAAALEQAGIPARREVPLSSTDRVDFLAGTIGIEIKVAGQTASVRRQLARYARSLEVSELILVTTRSAHRPMPPTLEGKPVHIVWLSGVIR
jgi:hypothetical protein